MDNINQILAKLPLELQDEILELPPKFKERIEEIRIRVGSPVIIISAGKEYYPGGKYGMALEIKTIHDIFNSILNHSAYAYQEELANGFITIEGGHRVGVCGRIIMSEGRIKSIKDVSSLNIRRCREIIGVADSLMPLLLDGKGRFLHTIIVSPPMCGKTTLLRDIIRNLSELGFRVGVCDERSEIAGSHRGLAGFNLGHRADVLDACPKAAGMQMLIRGMSPDIIATDEIGRPEDISGIEGALCAGVGLLTTIHGGSFEEISRSSIGSLVRSGIFKRYIYLSNRPLIGTILEVTDQNNHKI